MVKILFDATSVLLSVLTVVVLASPAGGLAAGGREATNIVPNPGAEKGKADKLPEGWSRYGNTPSDAGATQKVRHGGKRSAYLKVTGFGERGYATTGLTVGKIGASKDHGAIPVKPNTKYYFSFHIMGEGFIRGITVWPREFKADGSGVALDAGIEVIPKDDWLRHMGSFTTGAETERVVLTFGVRGFNRDVKSGAVFFVDDVYIGADKADAKAGVMNWRGGAMANDLWMTPDNFTRKIKHISDAELFGAMDLTRPGLEEVSKAVKARDYKAAYRAWSAYWARTHQVKPPSPQKKPNKRRLERAAAIMRHELTGRDGITIKHGPVVDFNADHRGSGKAGFHGLGWSWPLLRAYRATGDDKYLACFDKLFNQWYEQRDRIISPSELSVIWYELGIANRTAVILRFYRQPFSGRTLLARERMLKTLLGSARWLFELEKMGYDKGNWQMIGCLALARIGQAVPEFKQSQAWVRMSASRLTEHAERDFFRDGCHSERCPSSYMFIVYSGLAKAADMLKGNDANAAMSRQVAAVMERAAEFWMYMTTPEGHLSGINDGPRTVFGPKTLTEAGRRYNRKDFLFVAKNLLGGKIDGEVVPPKHTSINFPDSGFAVMRSDWTRRARYMLLNYGPDRVWHTHRDILNFEISAFGRALAIDAGLGRSYGDPLNNLWYNASRAHNMLVVDDGEIDRAEAKGRDVVWDSQSGLDFFAATTLGWQKDATVLRPGDEKVPLAKGKGVLWRRCVAFVKPDYWIVYDVARTAKAGQTLSWYFHSPTDLVAKNGGFASTKAPGLFVRPIGRTFKTRRGQGRASVRGLGFKKPYRDIDWVAFDAPSQKNGRVTFPMLLHPYEKSLPQVNLRVVTESDKGAHFVIQIGRKTDHVVFSIGKKGFRDKDIQTDGYCAVVRCRDGKPVSWSVAGGKKLVFPGINGTPPAPAKDSSRKTTNEGSDKTE